MDASKIARAMAEPTLEDKIAALEQLNAWTADGGQREDVEDDKWQQQQEEEYEGDVDDEDGELDDSMSGNCGPDPSKRLATRAPVSRKPSYEAAVADEDEGSAALFPGLDDLCGTSHFGSTEAFWPET